MSARDRCQCGHLQDDHRSNRTAFPHPLAFGVCEVTGCECREYKPETDAYDEAYGDAA